MEAFNMTRGGQEETVLKSGNSVPEKSLPALVKSSLLRSLFKKSSVDVPKWTWQAEMRLKTL
jgi:hypothetical protein